MFTTNAAPRTVDEMEYGKALDRLQNEYKENNFGRVELLNERMAYRIGNDLSMYQEFGDSVQPDDEIRKIWDHHQANDSWPDPDKDNMWKKPVLETDDQKQLGLSQEAAKFDLKAMLNNFDFDAVNGMDLDTVDQYMQKIEPLYEKAYNASINEGIQETVQASPALTSMSEINREEVALAQVREINASSMSDRIAERRSRGNDHSR